MSATPARLVLLALAPGLLATTLLFGPGTLLNLLAGSLVLLLLNRARDQRLPLARLPWVGAVVLAFALPPATPLWLVAPCAALVGLVHAGDATRRLPFNAALLAAALLFLVFPGRLPAWPSAPAGVDGWTVQVRQAFTGDVPTDASTGATALVAIAQRSPFTISEVRAASDAFGHWGGAGSEWVAIAWLAGGLWLLQRRVIAWHAPLGCLVGVACAAAALYEGDGALGGAPPMLHLLAGSTLLVAFFALTEPGSRPHLPAGQLLAGLFAGTLIVVLRHRAGGADHAAVVVLLANALAPGFDALGARLRRPERPAVGSAAEPGTITTRASPSAPPRTTAAMRVGPSLLALVPLLVLVLVLVPLLVLLESRLAPQRSAALTARAHGQLARVVFGDEQVQPPRNMRYLSVRAPGFGGDIRLLLAFDARGCLRGVAVLAHHESPGYGAPLLNRQTLADRAGWLRGLLDRCHDAPPGPGVQARVDGTTGATITANAVTRALRAAIAAANAGAAQSALQPVRPGAAARLSAAAEPGR